jgi:hypothetical protein
MTFENNLYFTHKSFLSGFYSKKVLGYALNFALKAFAVSLNLVFLTV